jgi:hypothetical protein
MRTRNNDKLGFAYFHFGSSTILRLFFAAVLKAMAASIKNTSAEQPNLANVRHATILSIPWAGSLQEMD